jgi:hypothetical protein
MITTLPKSHPTQQNTGTYAFENSRSHKFPMNPQWVNPFLQYENGRKKTNFTEFCINQENIPTLSKCHTF